MDKTKKIIDEIAELSAEEQEKIMIAVQNLLHTPNPEVEKAWAEEARRRLAAYKAGEIEAVNGEQVMAELREKYSK